MLKLIFGAAAGAAAAWFLAPKEGARRRSLVQDKAKKYTRRASDQVASTASHAEQTVKGKAAAVSPQSDRSPAGERLNDQGLAAKVESEIFRGSDASAGQVSVNVEDGTAYLRGQVEERSTIDQLVGAAGKVDGIDSVENLLHLPGEPAPAKD